MKIGKFDLARQVLIVAEIGNNHEGDFSRAQELVRSAARSGVNAVKFQTFKTERFVRQRDEARFHQLENFELTHKQFEELAKLARSLGLLFLSTALDLVSAEFLKNIVDAYKIASGDNDFYPLLARVAETGKPILISSGVSDFSQVEKTLQFVKEVWNRKGLEGELVVLHCVSSYPVVPKEANLLAIQFLTEKLKNVTVGYSDHVLGIDASVLAVALGARVIEKHFTLDKNLSDFRDHRLSADPKEMKELVEKIRNAETLLGKPEKVLQPGEKALKMAIRRSIVAETDLPKGHQIRWSDLTWLRPGEGLKPGEEKALVGRTLKHDISSGEPLRESDVE